MSGPKNIRCRNFNEEGVGICDSGEYCRFVHPGPRWANARPYNNPDEFEQFTRYLSGGGGSRGRPGGGGGGGSGGGRPLRRCRHYELDGSPIKGGCFRHPKGECRFTHPDQPGWDTATPSENSFSQPRTSFGLTGSNTLPTGLGRGGSTTSFGRASTDTIADTTSGPGFGFGTNETQRSPEPVALSSGWGQANNNEPEQPANETSGGGGWGGGDTNHGWGAGETSNTNSGWGGGDSSGGGWGSGGWGSSGDVSGSGDGGGWGSSSKDNVADTTQPTTQKEAADTNPPVPTSSDNTWGSSNNTWGSSDNNWGSSNNTWDSSNNVWGSSNDTWGSSGWGSSNNTWTASNETAQTTNTDSGKGNGMEWGSSVQTSGWSGWRDPSNPETTTGLHSSGGGWGASTPSVPTTVGATQDYTHATARLDTSPATMDVDEGEPQFEGKAILNALENVVHRRRSKRKRSHEDIGLSPRYYRHLRSPKRTGESGVDGDGDATMDGATNKSIPEGSLEPGEIAETPLFINYDMNVLSREPKTSEEKTTFAKHLLYIFAEAAVMVDRSRKAEMRYEDYKKSQEARIYNHPGPDARRVLVDKLHTLRTSSHEESERLERVVTDLGSLPSHYLSDVVAYNEHNHLTEDALAEERRKAAIEEVEKRLNEKHDCVDRKLLDLQARLEELAKEKRAREVVCTLPPPMDPNEMDVEEAVTVHKANVQRVAAVEDSIQAITSAESTPYRNGPIQTLEKSLQTADSEAVQLQEFAEGIARLIQQVPLVREEIEAIKTSNEEHKAAEKAHQQGMGVLDQQVADSSAQLEALNARVTKLVEGLQLQVTMDNIHSAIRPILEEQTCIVIQDVHECVDRGLDVMRKLIREERTQMRDHIYQRLVGTQKLFEAVGCYLRSVRADLASLVDKDRGTTEPS